MKNKIRKLNEACEKITSELHDDMEKMGNLLHQKLATEVDRIFNDIELRDIMYNYALELLKSDANISFLTGIAFPKK